MCFGVNLYIDPFDDKVDRSSRRKRNAHKVALNYIYASGDKETWSGLGGHKDDAWVVQALAISRQLFLQILTNIAEIENVVKKNKELLQIIAVLSAYTQKELGLICESRVTFWMQDHCDVSQ
jgi:hypothetical protein